MSGPSKQLLVRPGALPIDLFGVAPSAAECLDERQRDLAFPRIHAVGAGLVQAFQIAEVGRAGEHANSGLSSRAPRITSALFAIPADVRISVPALSNPALASVSGRVASP